jgi:sigma-B regulation protein RsbU (phosphoserine phosphatase)
LGSAPRLAYNDLVVWGFLLGLGLGAVAAWIGVQYYRQNLLREREARQRLQQEKTLVLEFMHHMVEGVGEEGARRDLPGRIVHAAVLGTGAVSGSLFRADEAASLLRSAATEGLFPPQRPLSPELEERLATRARLLEEVLRTADIPFGEGVIGEVATRGEAVLLNHPEQDDRVVHHRDPVLRIRSLLAVPMFFQKRLLGVLAVVNAADGAGFSATDLSLMASLGEQAALALHNAEVVRQQMEQQRLELDLSLARNIQGLLLPRDLPQVPSMDLAVAYETAQQVGGDMYQVVGLGDQRVGVAVADVSGKGVAASLLMAICQTSLRHLAEEDASPRAVLSRMNREILRQIRAEMFVTMVYAILDFGREEIRLARAGHELPLLASREGPEMPRSCRPLPSEGMALGMVEPEWFDEILEETRTPFRPGDLFLLFTDGITERTNRDGTEFSSSRLIDALRPGRGETAEEVKDAILRGVRTFAGEEPAGDDETLLVVRFAGTPPMNASD